MLEKQYSDSELVLALVAPVGAPMEKVRTILEERLKVMHYKVSHVRITQDVIPKIVEPTPWQDGDEHARLTSLMNAGNKARERSEDDSILALGAAAHINSTRGLDEQNQKQHQPRHAFIVRSLKRPEEVQRLRAIYPQGFYLIGVHADEKQRLSVLKDEKRIAFDDAKALIRRDRDEQQEEHGQRVEETFHLSDFFVRVDNDEDRLKHSVWRILDLVFGNPHVTPTFDEYAMFMAFVASLRSADLSRQVGAVVAVDEQVVATGANDVPKSGGGQYWSTQDKLPQELNFPADGRDFTLGHDANRAEQQKIIEQILNDAEEAGLDRKKLHKLLGRSRIRDLTEFGRAVHAEMDALLSCARAGISTRKADLYATTFPCHNCAKHILAAGVRRVVFIEPYQKSKAPEFHRDAIEVGFGTGSSPGPDGRQRVQLEPFVGVGPRRFFDLFSMRLGSGYVLERKNASGEALPWKPEEGRLRLQMLPASYLDLEILASDMFNRWNKPEARNAE